MVVGTKEPTAFRPAYVEFTPTGALLFYHKFLSNMNSNKNLTEMVAVATDAPTMTSLQIAEIAGRRHTDILRSIREMSPAWEKITQRKFALSSYKDKSGKLNPCYQLSKIECLYIATKFNDEVRAKLVVRWEELEHRTQLQLVPLYGVSPTVIEGKVLYCYHDALRAIGASTHSGRTSRRKALYPHQFVKAFGRNFITAEYFGYLKKCHEVHQLQISFRNEGGLNLW